MLSFRAPRAGTRQLIQSNIRSKDATRAPGLTTRSKKLQGPKGIATRSKDATRLEDVTVTLRAGTAHKKRVI